MSARFFLEAALPMLHILIARAHGMWTYEPRQGRNAATAVCSASAVVTLAFLIFDLGFTIDAPGDKFDFNRLQHMNKEPAALLNLHFPLQKLTMFPLGA